MIDALMVSLVENRPLRLHLKEILKEVPAKFHKLLVHNICMIGLKLLIFLIRAKFLRSLHKSMSAL